MSTFSCPVVRIGKVGKHPNADTLSIWNGPQGPIIFKNGDFNEGDLAVFVPVDSIVDTSRAEFKFLAKEGESEHRVRGIKLRGVPSVGLLIPTSAIGAVTGETGVGYDASYNLGVTKYQPPQTHSFGCSSTAVAGPNVPVYDIENHWWFDKCNLVDTTIKAKEYDTLWAITEKIHGCNSRFMMDDSGKVHIGSRQRWVYDNVDDNPWAKAYENNKEWLKPLLESNKGVVFYGETYGRVQDLHYGIEKDVDLVLFDAYNSNTGHWMTQEWLFETLGLRGLNTKYPEVWSFNGSLDNAIVYCQYLDKLLDGKSALDGGTMLEGFVIRPYSEEKFVQGAKFTRLITKFVTEQYLSRHNGTEEQ